MTPPCAAALLRGRSPRLNRAAAPNASAPGCGRGSCHLRAGSASGGAAVAIRCQRCVHASTRWQKRCATLKPPGAKCDGQTRPDHFILKSLWFRLAHIAPPRRVQRGYSHGGSVRPHNAALWSVTSWLTGSAPLVTEPSSPERIYRMLRSRLTVAAALRRVARCRRLLEAQ